MTRTYRALVFDLFGTVVRFRGAAPGTGPLFDWLRGPFAGLGIDASFEAFAAALRDVSGEIAAGRAPEHREIRSEERFRRALERLDPTADAAAATSLSAAHMAHLAERTELPSGHAALLDELRRRNRIGLVSNFDHAPTARAVLARHGIASAFEAVVISADHGRRKPHPSIFAAALAALGVAAAEALYVGDTYEDDVRGAYAAGLDAAWINRHRAPVPDPAPTYVLSALTDLRDLLD